MTGQAGFDRLEYPGDAVLDWLAANTNLVWCGYYLGPAPSQGATSWMGRRARLAASGWGVAPLYVGQQIVPPGSLHPSAAQGAIDGADAAAKLAGEGFPPAACVWLDLENGPPLTAAESDYVAAWCDAVTGAGFAPGIYCSFLLGPAVQSLCPDARIWAFHVATAALHEAPGGSFPTPDPAACGFAGAVVWQHDQNVALTVPTGLMPGGRLIVDLDSAASSDPGAP